MVKKDKIPTYDTVSGLYTFLYRLVGFLPFEEPGGSSLLITTSLAVFFQVMNAVYFSMQLTDILGKLIRGEFEMEYVFEWIILQCICMRFFMIYLKRAHLVRLMRICAKLWKWLIGDEEPLVVKSFESLSRYIVHIFLWSTVVAVSFYIITAKVARLPPIEVNGTERRILPFRWYVDVQDQPWYDLVSTLQEALVLTHIVVIITTESVGPYLIMMACGYLRSIQYRLLAIANAAPRNFNFEETTKTGDHPNKLSMPDVLKCIKFHQNVLQFCQEVENFMRSLFLVQVFCSIYNTSLIGLRITQADQRAPQYVTLLILNFLEFFSCQWVSQHLINESNDIFNAAYSATLMHPEYEKQANRALLFMMLKAECPVQMTAGGYINLSLETFKRMFMSAFSFFTVLRTMNA